MSSLNLSIKLVGYNESQFYRVTVWDNTFVDLVQVTSLFKDRIAPIFECEIQGQTLRQQTFKIDRVPEKILVDLEKFEGGRFKKIDSKVLRTFPIEQFIDFDLKLNNSLVIEAKCLI